MLEASSASVPRRGDRTILRHAAPPSAVGNGYVYNAKGRLVGHIESDGDGGWDVSDNCNSVIDFVEGRMRIYEGFPLVPLRQAPGRDPMDRPR